MKTINLNNKEVINIGGLDVGWTNGIPVKCGRTMYMVTVHKSALEATIQVSTGYPIESNAVALVLLKADAVVDRELFEALPEIQRAQLLCLKFRQELAL